MWGAEGRGWGRSSSIHSSPVHTPGLHCAQARREGPNPGVSSGVSSPSLTQKLQDALPTPLSLTATNHSPKPCSPDDVRASALHSSKTPAFLIGSDGSVVSVTCTSLGWDTVIAGERKGGHEDRRRQAWQVMSSGLYPPPPSLHPPHPH